MSTNQTAPLPTAVAVCESCKKRKKACNKELPSCGRCTRLFIKCSYPGIPKENDSRNVLPLFDIVNTHHVQPLPVPTECRKLLLESNHRSLSIDEEIYLRAVDCLAQNKADTDIFCPIYFKTFHKSMPILNKKDFLDRLPHFWSSSDSHLSTLLLSIFLITRLSPHTSAGDDSAEDLYSRVKSIYSMLQSTGKLSIELVQAGILIAAYEHCQALHQAAWLSIGACARVGQVLGYHEMLRKVTLEERQSSITSDTKRCVWWSIVILERVISVEYEEHRLPCTSEAPNLDDILPLTALDGDLPHRVGDDLVLPGTSTISRIGLHNRGFTRFGPFASSVQATYLLSLVIRHVLGGSIITEPRQTKLLELDTALQSFASSMIPPPGEGKCDYCGGYSMFTNAFVFLHQNEISSGLQRQEDSGNPSLSILALQSLSRNLIYATQTATPERPHDVDGMAFWAHRAAYSAAMLHIKLGQRNENWTKDLCDMKDYLRYFEPRLRLIANYLQELDAAEKCSNDSPALESWTTSTDMSMKW